MAGRHSQPSSARRGMSLPVVAAILLLVAACTAGILVYFNNSGSAHKAGGTSCDGKVTIFLDAAPSIADPVEAIAKKWVATNPTAGGKCVAVSVNSLPSANVEQILASGGNSGGGSSASVWIPDSSTWAARLNDDLAGGSRTGQIEVHDRVITAGVRELTQDRLDVHHQAGLEGRAEGPVPADGAGSGVQHRRAAEPADHELRGRFVVLWAEP